MKNILVFGATGYVGSSFIEKYSGSYNIICSPRSNILNLLEIDTNYLNNLIGGKKIDSILFLQGMNPTNGVFDITIDQFYDMLHINVVAPLEIIRFLEGKQLLSKNFSGIFISSVASRKGSYDPSYATSKSAIQGLQATLNKSFPFYRFNTISLGLVEDSPVYEQMTQDFREKHYTSMNKGYVQVEDVASTLQFLIENTSIKNANIPIDRGYIS